MKIYSILAHPNKDSLNGALFDRANQYFADQGHEIKTFDVFQNTDKIIESSNQQYYKTLPNIDKKQSSTYYINYGQLITDFSRTEIDNLKEADLLFIQTPILVWSLPGMLKLYIENVVLINEMFKLIQPDSDRNFEVVPFMQNKTVVFSLTCGSSKGMTTSVVGSEKELIRPIRSMFEFVGYTWMHPHITWGTTGSRELHDEYLINFNKFLIDNIKDDNGL